MKDTLFSETIRYWSIMSKEEKKQRLQLLENVNSKIQGRKTRGLEFSCLDGNTGGMFDPQKPDYLFINENTVNNLPSYIGMDIVYHEGKHSLIYDYLNGNRSFSHHNSNGKINLSVLGNASKESLVSHDIILDFDLSKEIICEEYLSVISSEENLVREETELYLLSNLLDICENEKDCNELFKLYLYPFLMKIKYRKFVVKNKEIREKYENLYNNIIKSPFSDNSNVITDVDRAVIKRQIDKKIKKIGGIIRQQNISDEQSKFLMKYIKENFLPIYNYVMLNIGTDKSIFENFTMASENFN
ncbi:MAG: hypothetical protein IJX26_02600, partial [Clostridia bacterium]|nr:hypothetical protein [Clostridia bacterium]